MVRTTQFRCCYQSHDGIRANGGRESLEYQIRRRRVSEYRIDFGPGYRIYFGRDVETLVILLCGGSKKRQQADIEDAKKLWADYKARKKAEGRNRRCH